MNRYKQIDKLDEVFTIKKPKAEAGYEIIKTMGPDPNNPKRRVLGWKKVKKKNIMVKHTSLSKGQRRQRAIKAAKTRKRDIRGQKLAKKRAKKTRAANKRAGLYKK